MLKFYSVQKLNHISRKRELWCWGCGKRFNEMLLLYKDEPFIKRISRIIDENRSLWGIEKCIGDKILSISNADKMKKLWTPKVIILLTTDRYQEVYGVISEILESKDCLCCKYPEIYFTYTAVVQFLMSCLPVKRQILFHAGKEPHENANAIADYLTNDYKGKHYKLIFLEEIKFGERHCLDAITVLLKDTLRCKSSLRENLRYCRLYAVSRFLIYENEPLKKVNRGQKLIYLNHGTIPLKDVHDVLKQPDELDFAICPSKWCAQIYQDQYHVPIEKLLYIIPPRTEYLKKRRTQLEKIITVKKRQVIIWLPTFRTLDGTDRKDADNPNTLLPIENDEQLKRINKQLCENGQILLIKNHPKEKEKLKIPNGWENIILLTDEILLNAGLSLHEILGDTAALLTDYSGISFEYLLLNKPIGYVIPDISGYNRGFAYDNPMDYMPGDKIDTIPELIRFFNNVKEGRDEYNISRNELMNQIYQGNEHRNGSQELIHFLDHLRSST